MTLKNAINFFESIVNETNRKSEIKVYQEFIQIITNLENRNLSENEIQSIETELDNLNLNANPKNSVKYFKNALNTFKKYLKDTYSLTIKGYYTERAIRYGILFGVVAGVIFGEHFEKSLGFSFGICMGLFIGTFVGRRMDVQAKAEGNML